MEALMGFFLALLGVFFFGVPVHGEDQSGFISMDCGIEDGASYIDGKTEIRYISDDTYVDTGNKMSISTEFQTKNIAQQFLHVRSFPGGIRNCYSLDLQQPEASKYLIRARFMYGNYDGKNKLPKFELHLGADVWDSVKLENASTVITKEIVHVLTSNIVYVCLVNTDSGTPFISALELRPLISSMYQTKSGSLINILRYDFGSTEEFIRYKDDSYDRIWWPPANFRAVHTLNAPLVIEFPDAYQEIPLKVLQTSITPLKNSSFSILSYKPDDPTTELYFYLYFADVQQRGANQHREFSIYLNGDRWNNTEPIVLSYLSTDVRYTTSSLRATHFDISLEKAENSTLPPIISSMEVYAVKQLVRVQTEEEEVYAIRNIKSVYALKRNWQGDPCFPKAYSWDGLNCSYDVDSPPRITSLNLSSSGLTGEIDRYISSLTMIQNLDLSDNGLTGSIPEFLSKLEFLKALNLAGNNLTGSVPEGLIAKSNNGLLSLSVDANICLSSSCKNSSNNISGSNRNNTSNKKKFVLPVVGASVATLFLILGVLIILRCLKRREKARKIGKSDAGLNQRDEPLELKKRRFTYSEILAITSDFEWEIGRGGFGTVYHGYLDHDTQVAVKMVSPSSIEGYEQFRTEAELLMRVHHRNLTSLVGYCNEGTNMALVYEFMANGNLRGHLSDGNAYKWEERLQWAIDAAQGLEYMHSGCKPPIIHRDVKSANILLNKEFQAKLGDFGLSRIFPNEDGSHVSTRVIGTPGYLDPEYYELNRLTEKSDVYSFGIVLLEIVTGRLAIGRDNDKTHITRWVRPLLEKGDIRSVVDPRLHKDFEINSIWRVVDLGMTCVTPSSGERPTMDYVVVELKECLALEKTQPKQNQGTESMNSQNIAARSKNSLTGPLAR